MPNQYGGNENLEAIDFLRRFNELAHKVPGAITVAEESTAFPGVSKPVYLNGLGFTMKWNMGWMHDMLNYFSKDPVYRKYHHNNITFSMLYAFTENFVLPISHDEVVHGKGSLLNKMPGDEWRQFANVRAFLAYMWAHPGKKLLFMGQEIGQREEWNHNAGVRWELLEFEPHRKLQALVRELNRLYRDEPGALPGGFPLHRIRVGGFSRRGELRHRVSAPRRRSPRLPADLLQFHAGAAEGLRVRSAGGGLLRRSVEHRFGALRRERHGQRRGGVVQAGAQA